MPYLLIGGAALFTGGGLFAAGEGVDRTGNGLLKASLALGVAYMIYQKVKK